MMASAARCPPATCFHIAVARCPATLVPFLRDVPNVLSSCGPRVPSTFLVLVPCLVNLRMSFLVTLPTTFETPSTRALTLPSAFDTARAGALTLSISRTENLASSAMAVGSLAALLQRLCVGLDEPADEPDVVEELAHDERAGPVVVCAVLGYERAKGSRRGVMPTSRALPQPQPFFTVSS